jgi:hypothetical protein
VNFYRRLIQQFANAAYVKKMFISAKLRGTSKGQLWPTMQLQFQLDALKNHINRAKN